MTEFKFPEQVTKQIQSAIKQGRSKSFVENYSTLLHEYAKLNEQHAATDNCDDYLHSAIRSFAHLPRQWTHNLGFLIDPYNWDIKRVTRTDRQSQFLNKPRIQLSMFFTDKHNFTFRWRPEFYDGDTDFNILSNLIESHPGWHGRPANEIVFVRESELRHHFLEDPRLRMFEVMATNCLIAITNEISDFFDSKFKTNNNQYIDFIYENSLPIGWDVFET